jgi:hypothetical protein
MILGLSVASASGRYTLHFGSHDGVILGEYIFEWISTTSLLLVSKGILPVTQLKDEMSASSGCQENHEAAEVPKWCENCI